MDTTTNNVNGAQANGTKTTASTASADSTNGAPVNGSVIDHALISTPTGSVKDAAAPGDRVPSWAHEACRDVHLTAPKSKGALFAVVALQYKLWGSQGLGPTKINYHFLDGNDVQHSKVKETITKWELYANVSFQEVDTIPGSDIRISFNRNDGSWSYIAKDAQLYPGVATMNLAWIELGGKINPQETGSILHEFGHALGLMHEHQSPARSGIFLDEAAAIEFYSMSQGWTEKQVRTQVLNVYNKQDVGQYSSFDRSSIMEYPIPSQLSQDGQGVGYNSELSDMDKAYISIIYPFSKDHVTQPDWNLRKSLVTAGVNADDAETISSFAAKGDLIGVRTTFFTNYGARQQAATKAHAIGLPVNRETTVDQAFVGALNALMQFLPDEANPPPAPTASGNLTRTLNDPVLGPVAANMISQAIIALNTRVQARVKPEQASDYRDIFMDPTMGPMLGQLLQATVSMAKQGTDDYDDTNPQAAHGIFDGIVSGVTSVFRNPTFQKVGKTLLDVAVNYVEDAVSKVAADPASGFRSTHDGAADGFFDDALAIASGPIGTFAKVVIGALI